MLNVSLRTNNAVILEGRITYLREYSKGKAANITLAVENGKNPDGSDRSASFVQTKSFTPDCYNKLELKMLARFSGRRPSPQDGRGQRLRPPTGAMTERRRPPWP